jgi:hypothetical protein
MKNQSLLICLSGFVFGVLISSFWDFGIYFGLFLALIAGAVFLVEKIEPAPKGRRLYFLSAFLLFFALGVLRFSATTFFAGDSFLDRHIGQVGEFEVQVSACFFFVSGKYLFRDDFFGYDLSNDVEQL